MNIEFEKQFKKLLYTHSIINGVIYNNFYSQSFPYNHLIRNNELNYHTQDECICRPLILLTPNSINSIKYAVHDLYPTIFKKESQMTQNKLISKATPKPIEKELNTFPKLMRYKSSIMSHIILAKGYKEVSQNEKQSAIKGFVIYSESINYSVGDYREDWDIDCLEDYHGTITLEY